MILLPQYFNAKPYTEEQEAAALALLDKVNALLEWASTQGYAAPIDPDTGTQISGSKSGAGDGGFRLSTATTGVPASKHKQARAVDVYDPDSALDGLLNDDTLERFGLYREHPDDTPGWCHLQDIAPSSGRRTFKP